MNSKTYREIAFGVQLNTTQKVAAGLAALLFLAMLLIYVQLVQLQVVRGEQMRQQWETAAVMVPSARVPVVTRF